MNCVVDYFKTVFLHSFPKVVISQGIMWAISTWIRNPTLVDVAWGLNHFIIGYSMYSMFPSPSKLGLALLSVWFLRLSGFLFYYRIYKPYVDPRYEALARNKNKTLYFFFQFQLQGVLTLFTSTPLYFALNSGVLNSYNYVGLGLCIAGIVGETIADFQLQNYKDNRSANESKSIFREGLFKNARHPNLFFELVFWFGLGLVGFNHKNLCSLFSFFGPVCLWAIMNFLTVPITTKHMLKTRGEDYRNVIKETNKFVPF